MKTLVDYTFICETEDEEKIKKAYYKKMKFVENTCEVNWETSGKKVFEYDEGNNQWTHSVDSKYHICGRQITTINIKKSKYEYVPFLHDVDILNFYPDMQDDKDCKEKEPKKKTYVQAPVNYNVTCKIGGGFLARSGN